MTSITTPMTKPRMVYLDLFRLIAAISVVVIHLTASAIGKYQPGSTLQFTVTLINGTALFAVPAFIFISGYTFMVVYRDKTINFTSFFKKRVSVLIIPYIAWSFIYYLTRIHLSAQPFNFIKLGMCLLTGSAFYHLYFMPIIFQFYLLFIPFKKLVERFSPLLLGVITLTLYYIFTSGLPFAQSNAVIESINAWLPLKADIPLSDRFFMSYLPFYVFGMLMGYKAEYCASILNKWAPVVLIYYFLTTIIHVSNRIAYYVYHVKSPYAIHYIWEYSAFGAILFLLWLTQQLELVYKNRNLITQLSGYTFDLYLAHPIILLFGNTILIRLGLHSISLILLILLIAGVIIPLGFAHLKNLLKLRFI